jgi:hypothetical protein
VQQSCRTPEPGRDGHPVPKVVILKGCSRLLILGDASGEPATFFQFRPTCTMLLSAVLSRAQAAAEYVGTMLAGAVQAVGRGFDAVGRLFSQNPVGIIIAAVVFLVLLAMVRRRR